MTTRPLAQILANISSNGRSGITSISVRAPLLSSTRRTVLLSLRIWPWASNRVSTRHTVSVASRR